MTTQVITAAAAIKALASSRGLKLTADQANGLASAIIDAHVVAGAAGGDPITVGAEIATNWGAFYGVSLGGHELDFSRVVAGTPDENVEH